MRRWRMAFAYAVLSAGLFLWGFDPAVALTNEQIAQLSGPNRQKLLEYINHVQWWLDRLTPAQVKQIADKIEDQNKNENFKFDRLTGNLFMNDSSKMIRPITSENMPINSEIHYNEDDITEYILKLMLYNKINNVNLKITIDNDWNPMSKDKIANTYKERVEGHRSSPPRQSPSLSPVASPVASPDASPNGL